MDQQHILTVPQGTFTLLRRPFHERSTLRAWDAADEYVLNHVDAEAVPRSGAWLLMNDGFGALACALTDLDTSWHSDSKVSELAALENLQRNDLASELNLFDPLQANDPVTPFAVVVVKVPKTLSQLEDQLHRVRPYLTAQSMVLGAGMAKHIHNSTLELFESIIGPTTTSLARKKARLIFAQVHPELEPGPSPHPVRYRTDTGVETVNHAGIFSQAKLDIGTRFLLETLPSLALKQPDVVVDLACGNGIVGTVAAKQFPEARLLFTDESAAAVRSAEATWEANHKDRHPRAEFRQIDVLDGVDDDSVDLVLLNPPFHEQNAINESAAPRMFAESRRVLRPGGQLVVVANRHLNYHESLGRIFRLSETVTGNNKFVILQASA